jgi:hypothetical protein
VSDTRPSRPEAVRGKSRRRLGLALALLIAVTVVYGAQAWGHFATRHDGNALRLLRADAPESRRAGAWVAAHEYTPRARGFIWNALAEQKETDPGVREAYVYALGRNGEGLFFDVIADVVETDPDAYVRQAAWLAAARVNPERFRGLAASVAPSDDPWDRIGRAAAWLEVGDLRGIDELLHWAATGQAEQRRVAALALDRTVAPLLETVGRWPIEYSVRESEPWPPELVAEVRLRCGGVNLQAIAGETYPHAARAAAVRRNLGRLNSARGYLAHLLGTG